MELKFTKNAVVIQVDEFELNLYGIEIGTGKSYVAGAEGLN